MKLFVNADLVMPDRIRYGGWLLEDRGVILETGGGTPLPQGDRELIDCKGRYLSPGFVDLHVHGGGGHDFMDGTAEAIAEAARAHLAHGTTTLLPTTLTSTDEDLFSAIDQFKIARGMSDFLPRLPGLHLEGPYFDRAQKGAQNAAYIRNPEPAHYESIMERAGGLISRWSVAPELDGALEMARRLTAQGVVMSIGHSNATFEQVQAAVDSGYTHVTHLYSGMSTIVRIGGFRRLGVLESAHLLDSLTVEIIADGAHLPPELLRLIVKTKDKEKICLVTDSMRGAGQPDGPSILGSLREGQEVIIENGVAKMPDRSCFAGSVATADRLVRVMHKQAELPLARAVSMMTRIPARIAGIPSRGSLLPGQDADLVLFDGDIHVKEVYIAGIRAYERN